MLTVLWIQMFECRFGSSMLQEMHSSVYVSVCDLSCCVMQNTSFCLLITIYSHPCISLVLLLMPTAFLTEPSTDAIIPLDFPDLAGAPLGGS